MNLVVDSCSDIANLVINPPPDVNPKVSFMRSLQIALTLESIWLLRNHVVHNGDHIKILAHTKAIEHRFFESMKMASQDVEKTTTPYHPWS